VLVARLRVAAGALLLGLFALPSIAAAHIVIDPLTSTAGATQLYTIAVPSEKRLDTTRVEVQFPRNLVILQLQSPPGWHVTPEKDGSSGRILGAIWEGGSTGPDEFTSFGVLAQNPNEPADLSWSAIQTYADGSEVQWFGPESSQFPATVTRVEASPGLPLVGILAACALIVSCAALALSAVIWWRLRGRARAGASSERAAAAVPRPVETAPAQPR
jgi:uncharacterized protein YcnI